MKKKKGKKKFQWDSTSSRRIHGVMEMHTEENPRFSWNYETGEHRGGAVRSEGSDVDEMRNIGMNGMEIGEGVHARTPPGEGREDRGRMVAGEKMEK